MSVSTQHHEASSLESLLSLSSQLSINIVQLAGFISACKNLVPTIKEMVRGREAVEELPTNIQSYLCEYLRMSNEEVAVCWETLKGDILMQEEEEGFNHMMDGIWRTRESVAHLVTLNLRKSLTPTRTTMSEDYAAAATMDVPFEYCPIPDCTSKLVRKAAIKGCLLTIKDGKLPILCPAMYCNSECTLCVNLQKYDVLI